MKALSKNINNLKLSGQARGAYLSIQYIWYGKVTIELYKIKGKLREALENK